MDTSMAGELDLNFERAAGRDERRSARPIQQLGRDLDAVVVHAVDAREIAAVLEAQGINDATAQQRFETDDVFATAEALFRSVPYRPPRVQVERPRHPMNLSLLRGALYLLPALWFHDALKLLPAQSTLIGLVSGVLFGWGWTQGLSYLAYQYPGRAGSRLASLGLLGVLAGGLLAAGLSLASGAAVLVAVLVGLAVGVYFTTSTLLMSLGRERWLLYSLLPGVLLSVAGLVRGAGHLPGSQAFALLGLALAVLVPLASAGVVLARQWDRRRPPRLALVSASPFALVGWLYAAFLSLDTLLAFVHQGPQAMLAQSVNTAPVVLCMGVMEWLAAREDAELRHAARGTSDMQELAARGRAIFADTTLLYLAALVLVTLAWNLMLSLNGQAVSSPVYQGGELVYGLALVASVHLANSGRVLLTVPAWILGVAVQFATHAALGPGLALLAGGLCALLLLLACVRTALNDITRYR